jgi:hypothetical protein
MASFEDRKSMNFSNDDHSHSTYWRFDRSRLRPDISNPGAYIAKAIRARFVEHTCDFLSLDAGRDHLFLATAAKALCSRVSGFVEELIRQLTVPDWSVFIGGDVGLLNREQLLKLLGAYGSVRKLILLRDGKATSSPFGSRAIAFFSEKGELGSCPQIPFRFKGFQHALLLAPRREPAARLVSHKHSPLPASARWALQDPTRPIGPMVHPSRMPRFTAPAATEAGATQPLLEPRLGRQTTVAVAVAAEPARAEATTTHAAEVNHAAVRIDDADARHALAADPLVSGPLALAEADLAAAGASAAATPTETEATAGRGAASAVAAADPARSEAKVDHAAETMRVADEIAASDVGHVQSRASSGLGRASKRKSIDKSADTDPTSPSTSPPVEGPKHRRLYTLAAADPSSASPQNEQAQL